MLHAKTYYDCRSSQKRIMAHQGGARAGKSMGVLEWLIEQAFELRKKPKQVVTICRKTLPACKSTILRDFIEILNKLSLYNPENHNKSSNEYLLWNTLFEFIGIDEPQKVRGRKRHVLFMNEANEFAFEDFMQLNLRTSNRVILDYNPSSSRHWIYESILTRDDCDFYKTTYKNNPFLQSEIIEQIERLQQIDYNLWQVFGLGERGNDIVQRPYIHNFTKSIHVRDDVRFQPDKPVIVSLDFNIDPFACVMAQQWRDGTGEHLHFFKEIKINNGDLSIMANQIKETLPPIVLMNSYFTGDASGQNRSQNFNDTASKWMMMQKLLNISPRRLKIPRSNPSVSGSRPLINLFFATFPDLKFSSAMVTTLYELQFTEADAEGDILKKNRDKAEQKADFLDAVRYLIQNFYSDWAKRLPVNLSGKVK